MATMEKLMKAFESLKTFQQQQGPPAAEELFQKHEAQVQLPPPIYFLILSMSLDLSER
uniref:Huntingtin n=1 Tax=Erpetoichthys calabaricus TaxID=27687 RepID=A0A8C4X3Q3_ERPCA